MQEFRNKPEDDDDNSDGDEDGDDDEGSEDGSEDEGRQQQSMTREERKAAVKAKKEAAKARLATAESDDDDDDEEEEEEVKRKDRPARGISVVNPNDESGSLPSTGLSRREREAAEAAAAKERYWKLQEAGKTDQARADMARLAIIRQEREEKARQRKAGSSPQKCSGFEGGWLTWTVELEEKKALAEAKAAARTGKR